MGRKEGVGRERGNKPEYASLALGGMDATAFALVLCDCRRTFNNRI